MTFFERLADILLAWASPGAHFKFPQDRAVEAGPGAAGTTCSPVEYPAHGPFPRCLP